jgi:MFS transporter, PPP family, 3-phenylpropionic acid transporter
MVVVTERMTTTAARKFWLPALYFLYYGASASLSPFLSVYYRHIGITDAQIGVLVSIPPLVILVGGPLWSGLADARSRHRQLLTLSMAGAMCFVALLSQVRGMALIAVVVTAYAFCYAPIMPLADSTTLALLGDERDRYGRIRMWGSIAWGVMGPLIGMLTDRGGLVWPFIGYLVLIAFALPLSTRLPADQARLAGPFWRGLRVSFLERRWPVFLVAVFVSGIAVAAVNNFLFLYMSSLGANAGTMGLALTVATIASLPFFAFTNLLVKRWGALPLFILGMFLFAVRFALYSVIHTPWAVLVVQLLHGPTFGAIWVSGVTYANEIAPPGMGATSQSIFSAVLFGLGAAAGGLICGGLLSAFGPFGMFRLLAVIVAAGLAIFWIAHLATNRTGGERRCRGAG